MSKRRLESAEMPPKRRRILDQLVSDFTPQMISPTKTNGPCSRSGRRIFTSPIVSTPSPHINKRKVYKIFSIHNDKLNPLLRLVSHRPTAIDTSPIVKLLNLNEIQMHNRSQDNEQMDKSLSEQCSAIDAFACVSSESGICMNDQVVTAEPTFLLSSQYCSSDSANASSSDVVILNETEDLEIITIDLTETETASPNDSYFDDGNDSMENLAEQIQSVTADSQWHDIKTNNCQSEENIDYEELIDAMPLGIENKFAPCSVEMPWPAGELVWAALSTFPFWPAIVVVPTVDEQHLLKDNKVNVIFLYDNGRTGWVNATKAVIPYAGLKNFEEIAELPANKKTKMYKKPRNKSWDFAVLEGDILLQINGSERIDFYKSIVMAAVLNTKQKLKNHRLSSKARCYTPQTSDTAYSSMKQSSSRTSLSPPLKEIDTNFDVQQNIAYYLESVENTMKIEPIDDMEQASLESDDMPNMFNCPLAESIDDFLMNHSQYNSAIVCRTEFRKALWAMCNEMTKPATSSNAVPSKRKRSISVESKSTNVSLESNVKQTKRQRSMTLVKQKEAEHAHRRSSLFNELQQYNHQIHVQKREKTKQERLSADNELIRKCNMDLHPANYLFKNVPKEPVCQICFTDGNIRRCAGPCLGLFHKECMHALFNEENALERLVSRQKTVGKLRASTGGAAIGQNNNMCGNCNTKETMKCFICQKDDVDCMKCCEKNCSRNYHDKCLRKSFPQYKVNYINGVEKLTCPQHTCHTCISSDVKNLFQKPESDRKLIKCLLCPGTYHRASKCIPAGSEILSEEQMICGRHHAAKGVKRINVDFCMLCSSRGELVCCDTCPHAFHEACLKIPVSDEQYVCEECESGKKPLYGEVVWVHYRIGAWWPAIVVPTPIIPEQVLSAIRKPQYFCVLYFGTHNFGWVGQSQVYSYQEGDAAYKMKNEKKPLEAAIDEAEQCIKLKVEQENKRRSITAQICKPKPYRKIKTNRITAKFPVTDDAESENICNCKSTDPSPCGIESNCVNQLLFIECDPSTCPAKDKCMNQCFENGPRYGLEIRLTSERGFGLFAKEKIPSQAFIIEYVGEVIDHIDFQVRFGRANATKEDNFYFLTLGNGYYIDAGPYGNEARFINHSCEPNSATKKWNVAGQKRIGFFAERDILPDEELTFFYNWGIKAQMCRCGSAKCRGFM